MVLAFVAPLQALAGIFAFLARDSGAATALTMLGAAWTATALTVLRTPPGGTSTSLGHKRRARARSERDMRCGTTCGPGP